MKRFYVSDIDHELVKKIGPYGHISSGYDAHFAWLFKHIEGDLILDLGIGNPAVFSKFLVAENNKIIIGTDREIRKATGKTLKEMGICLVLCDFVRLPFRRDFFKCIVSNSSIEHNKDEDLQKIFKEIREVLKGKIIFTVPFTLKDSRKGDYRMFSEEALEEYLSNASLVNVTADNIERQEKIKSFEVGVIARPRRNAV